MMRFSSTKRSVAWASFIAVVVLVGSGGIYVWRQRALGTGNDKRPADLLPLSDSPFQSNSASALYVGIATCAECHRERIRTYSATAHGRALSDVNTAAEPADLSFVHAASGRTYTAYRQGGLLHHREAPKDDQGKDNVVAGYPVRYLVGSGRHTRSYPVDVDAFLVESSITWSASLCPPLWRRR
jgi:hypothetical protein